jgi:hypothetical protein
MPTAVVTHAAVPAAPLPPDQHRFTHVSVLALRTHILRDWLEPGRALPEVAADFASGLPAPDHLL